MKRPLLLLFFCVPLISVAQDLTGIWRGHFLQSGGMSIIEKLYGGEDRYKFEVQLDQRSKQFSGVTYSYKTTVFYGKASCKGTVNDKTKKVLLEELKIVEVRMAQGSDACIMTLFLTYSKNGEEEFLEGSYTSMNTRDSSNCGRGTVFLRKVPTSDFYKEPFLVKREEEAKKKSSAPVIAKQKPKVETKPTTTQPNNTTVKKPATTTKKPVPPPVKKDTVTERPVVRTNPSTTITKPAKIDSVKSPEKKITSVPVPKALSNRQNELIRTIVVNTTDVVVDLYDNGTIDNDTVSVYLDKKLVVSKQRLTEKAITVKLKLDEQNDYHELVMVAENLGEIPPNTSLMVVRAGNKQYEVRITSNEQKNAVVIFKYEKPE
ncbi:MAG TPA: hypothetical protein VGD17_00775 [Chitinophagaceae bacterium]